MRLPTGSIMALNIEVTLNQILSLWWAETFDEKFGVLPDSTVMREEHEKTVYRFNSSQTHSEK